MEMGRTGEGEMKRRYEKKIKDMLRQALQKVTS